MKKNGKNTRLLDSFSMYRIIELSAIVLLLDPLADRLLFESLFCSSFIINELSSFKYIKCRIVPKNKNDPSQLVIK